MRHERNVSTVGIGMYTFRDGLGVTPTREARPSALWVPPVWLSATCAHPDTLGPRVVTESMLAGPLPRMEQVMLVCFTLDSGREARPSESPLSARSGHRAVFFRRAGFSGGVKEDQFVTVARAERGGRMPPPCSDAISAEERFAEMAKVPRALETALARRWWRWSANRQRAARPWADRCSRSAYVTRRPTTLPSERSQEVSQTVKVSASTYPACWRKATACAASPAASSVMRLDVTENRCRAGIVSRPRYMSADIPAPASSPSRSADHHAGRRGPAGRSDSVEKEDDL